MHVCACICRPEIDIRRLDLSMDLELTNWVDQMARELKGPPVPVLCHAKVTVVFSHTCLSCGMSGL